MQRRLPRFRCYRSRPISTPPPTEHPAPAPLDQAIPRDRLVVLFAVMLVAAAGNTALQSILPAIGSRLHIPDFWVSLAFSWSALLWVVTAPHWARQSDRRGRRRLMALGVTGFLSSMLFCGLVLWAGLSGAIGATLTFVLFALFRSLYGGFGSAAPPAVQAYIAARTPPAQRTRALALVASSFGLGTVIGPALAPFLIMPHVGLAGPLLVFALIAALVLVAVRTRLPDDTPRFAAKGVITAYPGAGAATAVGDVDADGAAEDSQTLILPDAPSPPLTWGDRRIRPWFVAGLLGGHANAMLLGLIGFVILDRLDLRATPDLAASPTGTVLMAGAFATLLAQWGLIPTLNLSARSSVLWGAGTAAVGTAIAAFAGSLHGLALGFAVAALGFGLFRPGFTAGASLAVPRAQQGAVAGMTASINGAAYIIAPAIAVLIYGVAPVAAFALIGVQCLILLVWGRARLVDRPAP